VNVEEPAAAYLCQSSRACPAVCEHTFIRCANNTLHDRAPVHNVVVYGAQFQEGFIGVVLVCLELRHEPLDGRCIAG
jgi:hypothetical protein